MNLGCGTLIFLVILVVVSGNLIPHGEGSGDKGKRQEASVSSQESAQKGMIQKGRPPEGKSSSEEAEQPHLQGQDPTRILEGWVRQFSLWVGEGHLEASLGPLAERVSNSLKAMDVEHLVEGAQGVMQADRRQPPNPKGVEAQDRSVPVQNGRPEAISKSSQVPSEAPVPGRSEARPGKHLVFNNPWSRSVDQVERYLKDHVHDPSSIEFLTWGQVAVTGSGYEVRCEYRTRNVLGKSTQQSQLFILDREGRVTDVRD